MSSLNQKSIVLGVGAGISAYRSLELIRLLKKDGAKVCVMPTQNALQFVGELSFEALSGQACLVDSLCVREGQIAHIEEAYNASAIIVAPATCDLIAKMAHGMADNLILQTLLSFRGPCVVAPAMETLMWEHEATQKNVEILKARGCIFVGPSSGALASGRVGIGRMAEPSDIFESLQSALSKKDFEGRRVLVTAGPTIEDIDPVRFISNRSSGKMGVAIARALAQRGATVELVHGPIAEKIPTLANIKAHPVRSATSMFDKVMEVVVTCDTAILSAAVADFTPEKVSSEKIKKSSDTLNQISLVKTHDILATLGKIDTRPVLIGFAAETQRLEEESFRKCIEKNCDLICGNLVSGNNSAFDSEFNEMILVDRNNKKTRLKTASKAEIAHQILDVVARLNT